MRAFVCLTLVWAVACLTYGYACGLLSLSFASALAGFAIVQCIVGAALNFRIGQSLHYRCNGAGAGLLYVESTVLLSIALLIAALWSRWAAAVLLLVYVLLRMFALYVDERQSWRRMPTPTGVPIPTAGAGNEVVGVAAVGALIGFYLTLPALKAAALGYEAYDRAIWIDAPFHASYISAVAQALQTGVYLDIHGAGLPVQFYHFGVYAIPAFVTALSGASALPMVQVLTAAGSIGLSIALYELAKLYTARTAVAAFAAAMVLVTPDAGLFEIGHSVFGFHWLLSVACGSAAGVSIALCAFALAVEACRKRSVICVIRAWALGLSVVLFKGQIFALIAVPLFLYPAMSWPGLALRTRGAMIGAMLALVAVSTWIASFDASLPLIRLDFSGMRLWLEAVGTTAPAWSVGLIDHVDALPAVSTGLSLLIVLVSILFNPWLALLLIAALMYRLNRSEIRFEPPRWSKLLLLLAACYVLAVLGLAPDNRMATGGPLEIQLQGMVWGYACFALACALYFGEILMQRWGRKGLATVCVGGFLSLMLVVPMTRSVQRIAQIPTASFAAAPTDADVEWLRVHAPTCGYMLVADGDPLLIWQGAVARPAWMVDYALNPKQRIEVTARVVSAKAAQQNFEEWLRATNITLYIEPKSTKLPALPPRLDRAPQLEARNFRAWFIAPAQACVAQKVNGHEKT